MAMPSAPASAAFPDHRPPLPTTGFARYIRPSQAGPDNHPAVVAP